MNEASVKRIAIRVDPETWEEWDDKRHAERLSFQELGHRLFQDWFDNPSKGLVVPPTGAVPTVHIQSESPDRKSVNENTISIQGELEEQCVRQLLDILRSRFPGPASAVASNIKALHTLVDLLASHGGENVASSDPDAAPVPSDNEARMARIRELAARSGGSGKTGGVDASGLSAPPEKHPRKASGRRRD